LTYNQEIYRKLIHIASVSIPISYWFVFNRSTMLWILLIASAAILVGEILRLTIPFFDEIFSIIFGKIIRGREKSGITGASYTLLGSLITIWIFEKEVAIFALIILAICDSTAALVGIKWGKSPLLNKSVQGTMTFLSIALVIVFVVPVFPKVAGICSVFVITVVELLPSPINDNLLIPLTAAVSFSIVNLII